MWFLNLILDGNMGHNFLSVLSDCLFSPSVPGLLFNAHLQFPCMLSWRVNLEVSLHPRTLTNHMPKPFMVLSLLLPFSLQYLLSFALWQGASRRRHIRTVRKFWEGSFIFASDTEPLDVSWVFSNLLYSRDLSYDSSIYFQKARLILNVCR